MIRKLLVPTLLLTLTMACGYTVPKMQQGKILYDNEEDRKEIESAGEIKAILTKAQAYVAAIVEKKPAQIIAQVSKNRGAYVDLKAQADFAGVEQAVNSGVIYRVYWQGVDEVKTIRQILSDAKRLTIDIHFYNPSACEVSLQFENRPSLGVLSNAIYHKYDEKWFLARLF